MEGGVPRHFAKQDHAFSQDFHVSTEELTSKTKRKDIDVSAIRVTTENAAKNVLKVVKVCTSAFRYIAKCLQLKPSHFII